MSMATTHSVWCDQDACMAHVSSGVSPKAARALARRKGWDLGPRIVLPAGGSEDTDFCPEHVRAVPAKRR
jgi:hypothetical protein